MLKFIFMLMTLMYFVESWALVQTGLLFTFFITALLCNHDFKIFSLGLSLGMDHLSFILVLLSIWIMALIVISSTQVKMSFNFPSFFLMTNLLLLFFLVLTFSATDYLFFYIAFEASLVPTLILILGWGYQPERIQAGVYMLFYTLFASLPLLVSLLFMYKTCGTLSISSEYNISGVNFISMIWFISSIMAFIVKLPMYFFHLWLPKAHVEAPVAGSMILAGILLKLGGYGLIRILPIFSEMNKNISWLWISMSIVGGFFVSVICLRQVDMKSLIAYSSVAHMSLVLGGLLTNTWWGVNGATVIMVGHGLCSSGLFCMANMVYERTGSRSLLVNKGLLNFMPSMALWWFLLSIGNMAAPPSINLLGEINLIMSLVGWSKNLMLGICLLSFFSAAYTLYLYSLSQHGTYSSTVNSCCSGKVREYLVLGLHWLPLNFLILKGSLIMPSFCLMCFMTGPMDHNYKLAQCIFNFYFNFQKN
uniref:NADH dehydrogenase subunit 4 n=1 Tax=Dardanus arrosor TaxID=1070701 RepID=UPI001EDD2618|nr:NADH dehydrogenase subunit 4 [Dardanus arrosor]UIR97905.1 NADH dehydrogenase subunit 4 [Dardanus arrosor]